MVKNNQLLGTPNDFKLMCDTEFETEENCCKDCNNPNCCCVDPLRPKRCCDNNCKVGAIPLLTKAQIKYKKQLQHNLTLVNPCHTVYPRPCDNKRKVSIKSYNKNYSFNDQLLRIKSNAYHKNVNCKILYDWVQIGQPLDGGEKAKDNFNTIQELDGRPFPIPVFMNAAGTRVAIGFQLNDGTANHKIGHVKVYEYKNNKWLQLGQELQGEIGEIRAIKSNADIIQNSDKEAIFIEGGDEFGYSVSMNAEGTRLAIGAPRGDDKGYFKVYQYNADEGGGEWQQLGKKILGDDFGDAFGYSVSMNAEGNRVAIGAPARRRAVPNGYIKVYQYNADEGGGGVWQQLKNTLNITDNEFDLFGFSVSMNEVGNRVAISAPVKGINKEELGGAVTVYRLGDNWEQLGPDIEGDSLGDMLGDSVSMNAVGNIVAIGSVTNQKAEINDQVRIFRFNGTNWVQLGHDIITELQFEHSNSVSMNAAGNIVAIGTGSLLLDGKNNIPVTVYRLNGNKWVKFGTDILGKKDDHIIKSTVSINAVGTRLAISEIRHNDAGNIFTGDVKIYEYRRVN